MRLLLDTNVVIALLEDRAEALPRRLLSILSEPGAVSYCSVASLWEIAIKHRLGKLPLRQPLATLPAAIAAAGPVLLAISAPHALA
jgi:PIN domain nuclease of toxin-antitoxin system